MTVEKSFPNLLDQAERMSIKGQQSYMRLTYAGLLVALLASIGGAINIDRRLGEKAVDLGGALAGLAFIAGIFIAYYLLSTKPERAWYEGRAAAESIKTMSWQYCVAGGAFGYDTLVPADKLFLDRLKETGQTAAAAQLTLTGVGSQITNGMRSLRAAPLADRMVRYRIDRLEQQNKWYAQKAADNRRRARLWFGIAIILQAIGLVFAALKTFDVVDVDLLGIVATAAASASAWLQTKDHQNLAESYAVTSRDLSLVLTKADSMLQGATEEVWRRFVEDAEHAISREHTLWLARRGIQTIEN
ncbi:DUF4231 domain-containing protein [Micromonospora sp. HUAS YX12]|uniref:DUF4231 domain-containing protein n=1 Tax=Micromonospora sp. HUAS YX12 TaxID=3156396 RepID=A0AAU7R3Q4_9ACTN